MKLFRQPRPILAAIRFSILFAVPGLVQAYSPNPDLTAAGAIAALKADTNSSPLYQETYNLGPTGLRGWIYIDRNNMGAEGLITAQSRQILVTVASTPGNAVLAVDDVILGAMAGSSGAVPLFTSDCRKAFGLAIGEAEKTGAGTLRVKRWRAGATSDVNITMTVMGDYAATAPFNCPKSSKILAAAITKLNAESLSNGWTGAAGGLALLAAVKPGVTQPEIDLYNAVQTKVRNFAHAAAPTNLTLSGCDTWNWGYIGVFLSEYYLRTVADGAPDATVLHGINEYTVALAKGQSKYGTFGHGGAAPLADGTLHGSISWYGPVNSAGLVANLAIVLGKKALLAGGMPIDPEIDPAIARASNFFAYYVNKGGIPYGEHEPWSGGHASNGKDAMAAVMFALQDNKPVETEYFTRMSVAGWVGREYGHTGQGFSYLWAALGAGMGGDAAAAAHLNQVRWHLDLERRTDGSFVYDGGEQYGANTTATYLGSSSYSGLSPNACYVLTYALPLKRLFITGRNANPANTLDAAKVANEIAAATYERDCVSYSVTTLMTALSEYDPVVRHDAAAELAKRSLSTTEVNNLIALITNGTMSADANVRQGACEALGIRKSTSALTALAQRLSDTDLWVRGKAANALKNFGSAAGPQLTPMLTAFAANATDPDVIVWDDPIQIANGYLASTLFQTLGSQTIAASKNLLYPAVEAGLKQPDGMARMYLGDFIKNRLTYADVQAVAPSLVAAVAERSPADQMFSDVIRYAGLQTLAKYQIEEGIPLCLMVKEQTWHGDDWQPFEILRNTYGTAAKEVLPTLYVWMDNLPVFAADGSIGACCPGRYENIEANILSTIVTLEANTPPPALNHFKTVTVADANLGISLQTTNSVQLSASATDLDGGVPRFTWSKVSGPGPVSFSSNNSTGSSNSIASFTTVGSYVLRVSVSDSSIMNEVIWWKPHRLLGYYDFHTYDNNYGTVSTDVTVEVYDNVNSPPGVPGGLMATRGDALVDLNWNSSFRAASYHVKRSTAPGGPYATIASPVTPSYQDASVVNNTTYYYVVSAVNEFGESADSTQAGAIPGVTPLTLNVNIDGAARSGLAGPAGGLGKTWAQPLALAASSLLDSEGRVTSVGFTCNASNLGQWGAPTLTLLTGGAFNWTPANPYALTISGLTTGKKYDLSLASFHPNEDGSRALFSTGNTTDTSSPQTVDNGGGGGNSSTWVEGVNYARFRNVEPNGSGQINLTIAGQDTTGNRRRAYLSGFQLMEVVPTYALTVNSGLGDGSYPFGEAVPITANTVPQGQVFDVWVVNAGSPLIANVNAATTTLTMPASAATVTATYKNLGPAGYTWSASEGQTVNFVGTVDVAYGANGQFFYLYGVTGSITFNNATFGGDPVSGMVKAGYYRAATSTTASQKLNVNIDVAARTGLVGPAGGLGETWNQAVAGPGVIPGIGRSALLDAGGTVTSVGFTSSAGNLYSWGTPSLGLLTSGAFQWNWNSTSNLVIGGLTNGRKYDLYIASFHPNELGSSSLFSTANTTTTSGTQIANTGGPNGNASAWVEGVNYVRFQNIEPTAGNITVTMVGDSGTNQKRAYLSGFQLVDVTIDVDPSPFSIWAGDPAQGLTAGVNDGPMDDPDWDGIVNLMEFTLRGHPLLPSSAILPTMTRSGTGAWLFEYERSNPSAPPATTQVVEYGSDLSGWTPVTIPATSADAVTITPGSSSDHVSVTIPDLGVTGFARLKVTK
jgi:HEAT repeat protein